MLFTSNHSFNLGFLQTLADNQNAKVRVLTQNMKKTQNQSRHRSQGFSLAELIVAIAVLGTIVGLFISYFSNTPQDLREITEITAAKNIAEKFNAAQGAGAKLGLKESPTTEEIVKCLSKGAKKDGLGVEPGTIDPNTAKWLDYSGGFLQVRQNPRPHSLGN